MTKCSLPLPCELPDAPAGSDVGFPRVADVVQAFPYLIGFPPADSLVCAFWSDEGHLVLTARSDWSDVEAAAAEVGKGLAERAALVGAVGGLCAAVSVQSTLSRQFTRLRAVRASLSRFGIASSPGIVVGGGRWRSRTCGSQCPELGHDLEGEGVSALVAGLVASGRVPVASREAVAQEVRLADDVTAGALALAAADLREGITDLEEWRDRVIMEALDAMLDGGYLSLRSSAAVAAACEDVRARDTVLWCLEREPAVSWDGVWASASHVLRMCRGDRAAAVGAVAAIAAWQAGDGLRAGFALERAYEANPDHSLADLIREAMGRGLPPEVWSRLMRDLTHEECRRDPRVVRGLP
ncbi:MAG: DUF4192 family protein [Candidatus Nanopelagicales bacterium]|nr:DUF4192 family protein [Candidatus Nanopelagicales bacterium]MDZ4249446.1 DUF4192 family protein [Candidatus Nanopelagicales bacterium]